MAYWIDRAVMKSKAAFLLLAVRQPQDPKARGDYLGLWAERLEPVLLREAEDRGPRILLDLLQDQDLTSELTLGVELAFVDEPERAVQGLARAVALSVPNLPQLARLVEAYWADPENNREPLLEALELLNSEEAWEPDSPAEQRRLLERARLADLLSLANSLVLSESAETSPSSSETPETSGPVPTTPPELPGLSGTQPPPA